MLEWHQNLVRKVSEKNVKLALTGKIIFWVALGSIFSTSLARYSYYLLIIILLIGVGFTTTTYLDWYNKRKTGYGSIVLSAVGTMLLAFLFGIQSPQIPFKGYILALGILIVLPVLKDLFKKRGKK